MSEFQDVQEVYVTAPNSPEMLVFTTISYHHMLYSPTDEYGRTLPDTLLKHCDSLSIKFQGSHTVVKTGLRTYCFSDNYRITTVVSNFTSN